MVSRTELLGCPVIPSEDEAVAGSRMAFGYMSGIRECEVLEQRFAGNRDRHHQWDEVFIRVAPPGNSKMKSR